MAVCSQRFRSIPSVLLIQLLLFDRDGEKSKVITNIPGVLPCKFLGGCVDCVYNLSSVVEHVGTVHDCGHYLALALAPSGELAVYDDALVLYEHPTWQSLCPYLIFY
jgi:hypothetical protein